MEELKFLSAAILALILAVSCQNEYDPAAGYSQMYGGAVIMNGGWTRFRCIP